MQYKLLKAPHPSPFSILRRWCRRGVGQSSEHRACSRLNAGSGTLTSATVTSSLLQAEKAAFEVEAKQRAQDSLNRYGEQEVCKYSGVIINSEESRLRDHKAGKNYRRGLWQLGFEMGLGGAWAPATYPALPLLSRVVIRVEEFKGPLEVACALLRG